MKTYNPEITLQTQIGNQLRGIMQFDALSEIRLACHSQSIDFQERSAIIATGLQVTPSTMPDLHNICYSVKEKLGFTEDVDFYLTGDAEVNATSYYSEVEDESHIVVINSAMFNLMNEDELKFIIGHEIGHLINRDNLLTRQLNFIYNPDDEDGVEPPLYVNMRMNQYNQLAEYGADRYGYLACENVEACITAFYKLNSGIDLHKAGVSIEALIEENDKNIGYIFDKGVVNHSSHPDTPCRVFGIVAYALSKTQKSMNEQMECLYDLLPMMKISNAEYHYARYQVAAGYMLAEVDGKADKREITEIVQHVAEFMTFPTKFIKEVLKEDREQVIVEAVDVIKEEDPETIDKLLPYLIKVAMADDNISKEEIDFIVKFGTEILDLDLIDVYSTIEASISSNYDCGIDGL